MLRAFLSSCRKIRERTRLSGSHKETRKVGLWIRPCLEVLEDRTLLSTSSPGGLFQQIQQAETTFVQSFLTNIYQMIQQFIRTEAAALAPWVKLLPSQPTVNVTIDGVPSDVSIGTTINLTSTVVEQHQLIPHQEIFSYAWSVTKDGAPYATGNQANFSFTPDSDDTYVVTLTATDMFGRTGTASASIDPLVSGGGTGGSGPGSGSKPQPGSVSVTLPGVTWDDDLCRQQRHGFESSGSTRWVYLQLDSNTGRRQRNRARLGQPGQLQLYAQHCWELCLLAYGHRYLWA